MELTPSRKVKMILVKILEYAEMSGMSPDDCGTIFETVSACLTDHENPEDVLSGLIDQINQITDGKEIAL